mmetsp:Transcript_25502/g.55437  ORF Transcript_25502/g.55437 Transcript_25502/m.55437 type:complete len:199 (-) Transcript_25502:479-1075(-)
MASVEADPNCERPACASKSEMFNKFFKMQGQAKGQGKSDESQGTSKAAAEETISPSGQNITMEDLKDCPPDREEIGRDTWTLLHTIAAYYPNTPSVREQCSARTLVKSLAQLYPCTHCKGDFQKAIEDHPPRVKNREEFSRWVCEQHNLVNEKLGKPSQPCDLATLDTRWKLGSAKCRAVWEMVGKDSAPSSMGVDDE